MATTGILFLPFHTVDGELGWEPTRVNISLDSDDGLIKYRPSDLTVRALVTDSDTQTLTNKTLTSPVITEQLGAVAIEDVITTNVIAASESGKTFFLNLAAGFVSTLPAPAAGLAFTFIVKTAPTGSYTIVTTTSANIMLGIGVSGDMDAAGDVDAEATGGDTLSFVLNKAVIGDWAHFVSDGTSWYVRWGSKAFDGITITTAS